MLKQRVLTAIPLIALVVWGLLTQPAEIIFYALLFVLSIGSWEWARLSGVTNKLIRVVYSLVVVACIYFLYHYIFQSQALLSSILTVTVLFWFVASYFMFVKGPSRQSTDVSPVKLVMGFVVLVPPVLALMLIREQGAAWLFYCLSFVWVADSGAYFAGKKFGKVKLAPSLSPGKTKEGLYGALFATAVYSFAAANYFELQVINVFMLLIISVLATFVSVVGDLFISLLKRETGLKDTGMILPGHGGVLDRIDSVTSSAPFFALFLSLVIFNV